MGQVTVTKVVEGPGHLVIKIDLLSDGTGELENYVVLSPSDLNPRAADKAPAFSLLQVWYGLVWFDVAIKSGTLAPAPMWTLPRDLDHIDFRSFGGIQDVNVYSNPPADDNGKLTISTNGFDQAGSSGTIVLELRKTSRAS